MFGFQRVGDFAWAAGDMHARGFLLGGAAGVPLWLAKDCNIRMAIDLLCSTFPNCVVTILLLLMNSL